MKRACRQCIYYDPVIEVAEFGRCKRHPPTIDMIPIMHEEHENESGGDGVELMLVSVNQIDITRRGVWPEVSGDDWCGEYVEEIER